MKQRLQLHALARHANPKTGMPGISPHYDVHDHRGPEGDGIVFSSKTAAAPAYSSTLDGGARRDRTDDLMLAKHALSQLSYGPVPEDECRLPVRRLRSIKVVGLGRLELPTSRLSSARSNQLSYKPLTRGACQRAPVCTRCVAQAQPLARVRPRRKRNEDGEIPPMQLNNPDDRWPLMFQKRFDSSKLQVASF